MKAMFYMSGAIFVIGLGVAAVTTKRRFGIALFCVIGVALLPLAIGGALKLMSGATPLGK